MENPRQIQMIFFDAAGTLFTLNEGVGEIYARGAAKYGCTLQPETLQANFHQLFPQQPPLAFAPQLSFAERCRAEKKWWHNLVSAVFSPNADFAAFDDFFAELYAYFADPNAWRIEPDVIPTLEKLRQNGTRLGVISNFDSRLHQLLAGFDLTTYFDSIHISSEVGAAKPNPEIFQSALKENTVQADLALHVGDSWAEDIDGALRVGMRAVWIAPADDVRMLIPSVTKIQCFSDLLKTVLNS